MPKEVVDFFAPRLVAWQRSHGRNSLPWQNTRDPYRVWLSEIMLQQTQVTTVLGYYQRFLERFPTVLDLGAATLDEVLALWAGLGYYSRARNLHACAQAVASQHAGQFPGTAAALQELPGIGRSTAAAIAAFCFGERVAILDGNVKRVLTRLLAFEGDMASAAEEKKLWLLAAELLPAQGDQMTAYTQGLMDLGSGVCTARSPQCLLCPVQELCAGRAQGEPTRFPIKTKKLKRSRRENWWLWLEHEGQVLLSQRPATGVWAGLWSLPMYDDEAALQQAASALATPLEPMPGIKHVLTHFDWTLHTQRAELRARPDAGQFGGEWVARERLAEYALPAPLKKLIG
ncbi:A/G-specific adenine glycosylase [Paucibacter sp. KCTC 42545]|uniref:A/G-specific adenine glycosylase n=1 Tax=Paucibacter sp. KCTC 42545 TaxID=1768242 RepID=UPI000733C361|nr:A/G-specific adenine glycosylase [Paucibacter sp. KCTC 42545]ALT76110.1 A/G-specific adenine glycosylase [Paucibacter sp. KCTC 42545]